MSPGREISTCAFWESWCWRLRRPAARAIALRGAVNWHGSAADTYCLKLPLERWPDEGLWSGWPVNAADTVTEKIVKVRLLRCGRVMICLGRVPRWENAT